MILQVKPDIQKPNLKRNIASVAGSALRVVYDGGGRSVGSKVYAGSGSVAWSGVANRILSCRDSCVEVAPNRQKGSAGFKVMRWPTDVRGQCVNADLGATTAVVGAGDIGPLAMRNANDSPRSYLNTPVRCCFPAKNTNPPLVATSIFGNSYTVPIQPVVPLLQGFSIETICSSVGDTEQTPTVNLRVASFAEGRKTRRKAEFRSPKPSI